MHADHEVLDRQIIAQMAPERIARLYHTMCLLTMLCGMAPPSADSVSAWRLKQEGL